MTDHLSIKKAPVSTGALERENLLRRSGGIRIGEGRVQELEQVPGGKKKMDIARTGFIENAPARTGALERENLLRRSGGIRIVEGLAARE